VSDCRRHRQMMALSLGSLVLQQDNIAGGPAGKQRADQVCGRRLVAVRTLIPFKAVSMCVGDREGAGRGW
jgi:hypothetical protein